MAHGREDAKYQVARGLFLYPEYPDRAVLAQLRDGVAFGFGGARNVPHSARVIESQFENVSSLHCFKAHLCVRPIQRAPYSSKIEANKILRTCFHQAAKKTAEGLPEPW
jgi:hypothetical protein